MAGIHPWMEVGDAVLADLVVNGKLVSQLDHKSAVPGLKKQPAMVFALPAGLKRLRLRGKVTISGKTSPFDTTWQVRDIAHITVPLYDQKKSWIQRVRALATNLDEGSISVQPNPTESGKKTARLALKELEKRLGTPLPAMLRLLSDWDIEVGNSQFLPPASMSTVTERLLGAWGYKPSGKNGLNKLLPQAVRARFDRSLVVFVEGDGDLGGLAWDPVGVTVGEPPNTWGDKGNPGAQSVTPNQGVWYWLHQDALNKPALLLDDNYRPKTTEAVFTHALQRFALTDLELAESDKELIVDTANPRANLLELTFQEPRQPRLRLRSYDRDCSLY